MEWPRIKTMILTILLITNIGLLSFVLQRAYQGRQMQQEARENAILFLHNSGIEVDPAAIPGQMGLLPQTVKRDREQESRIASALLGGAVQELSWGAEAFRYYNEKGYLQFHRDGALKGEFVEGEFPIQEPESMDYTQQVLRLLEFEGGRCGVHRNSGGGGGDHGGGPAELEGSAPVPAGADPEL